MSNVGCMCHLDIGSDSYEIKDKKARQDIANLYFDTVADMLACITLNNGDVVKTLGYHSANDGGGALYLITNENLSSQTDNITVYAINNNIYAKIVNENPTLLQLGGYVNDNTKGTENLNIIKKAIEKNIIINLDNNNFYIKNTETKEIEDNIIIINGKITITNDTTQTIFKLVERKKIIFKNIEIESLTTDSTTFLEYEINPEKIEVSKCYFKGSISLIRTIYISGTSDPNTDTAIERIIFDNNKCCNLISSFLVFNDTKFDLLEITNNEVHNFSYVFCHTGIDNLYASRQNISDGMKEIIIKGNYVHNDINYNVEIAGGSYFCFILTEGKKCIYENNHVEGLHTSSNVTCVDAYLCSQFVYYRNNINKNNIAYHENGSYSDCFFKVKSGTDTELGYGEKYCENNKFILDSEYATALGISEDKLRKAIVQAISLEKVYIRNNIFDCVWLKGTISRANSIFKEFEFINNTIKCKKVGMATYNTEAQAFFSLGVCDKINISNNFIEVTNSTKFSVIEGGSSDIYLISKLIVNDNFIKGNLGSLLQEPRATLLICKNNIVHSETAETESNYPFYGIRATQIIIKDNLFYEKNGAKRLNPFLYLEGDSVFNSKYIMPLKTLSTDSLSAIKNKTYYYDIKIKTKNEEYQGKFYIKGVIDQDEVQQIYIIPKNETSERAVVGGETIEIKMGQNDNLSTLIKPLISGTNKTLSWQKQSGYVANTVLEIELNIRTI